MKPMLAQPFQEKRLSKYRFAQPKLDGIRLLWNGKEARSRNDKPIEGVPEIIKELETRFSGIPLDGELYCHGMHFQDIISSVRRTVNIKEDLRVGYHVYDSPVFSITFYQRWKKLEEIFIESERIKLVKTIDASDLDYLNIFAEQGYEGTMIRNAHGIYEFGKRSFNLLKVKTTEEAEFKLIGFQEGTGKYVNMLGAFVCKNSLGNTFNVGTGFDDAQRTSYWNRRVALIGSLVTVQYQELTRDGIPRFPRFKAIRDYE